MHPAGGGGHQHEQGAEGHVDVADPGAVRRVGAQAGRHPAEDPRLLPALAARLVHPADAEHLAGAVPLHHHADHAQRARARAQAVPVVRGRALNTSFSDAGFFFHGPLFEFRVKSGSLLDGMIKLPHPEKMLPAGIQLSWPSKHSH